MCMGGGWPARLDREHMLDTSCQGIDRGCLCCHQLAIASVKLPQRMLPGLQHGINSIVGRFNLTARFKGTILHPCSHRYAGWSHTIYTLLRPLSNSGSRAVTCKDCTAI